MNKIYLNVCKHLPYNYLTSIRFRSYGYEIICITKDESFKIDKVGLFSMIKNEFKERLINYDECLNNRTNFSIHIKK